jgi:hypothetical protein
MAVGAFAGDAGFPSLMSAVQDGTHGGATADLFFLSARAALAVCSMWMRRAFTRQPLVLPQLALM